MYVSISTVTSSTCIGSYGHMLYLHWVIWSHALPALGHMVTCSTCIGSYGHMLYLHWVIWSHALPALGHLEGVVHHMFQNCDEPLQATLLWRETCLILRRVFKGDCHICTITFGCDTC